MLPSRKFRAEHNYIMTDSFQTKELLNIKKIINGGSLNIYRKEKIRKEVEIVTNLNLLDRFLNIKVLSQ